MNEFYAQAADKLEKESKAPISNVRASAMKGAVKDALLSFCEQDGEFAQAVAQGGSFQKCMEAVAHGVGSSISDLEAYKRAVQFYFPGAEIRMSMSLDLIGAAAGETKEPPKRGMVLDLTDFL